MSSAVYRFEKEFAKFVGAKYAVMVNSGSSANLLSVFAACNPLRKDRFKIGDEAIIPALCWSTSLWPLVQAGLKPVFVDIDKTTLNIDIDELIKKITPRTKVIMAVHVLGNSSDIKKIKRLTNWSPKVSIKKGIQLMLKDIDNWRDAPLWTPKTIEKATKKWFLYLNNK